MGGGYTVLAVQWAVWEEVIQYMQYNNSKLEDYNRTIQSSVHDTFVLQTESIVHRPGIYRLRNNDICHIYIQNTFLQTYVVGYMR